MMKLAMWGQALRTMPNLNLEQWQELDLIAKWLIASRASVLIMTFSSAAIGGLFAARVGEFSFWLWLLCTLGLMFAHATNNLLNDYIDSAKGIDKDNYYRNQYGVHLLESNILSKSHFWRYIIVTGGLAGIIGAILIYARGDITLLLMSIGAFFVVFYTWPLKYIGLGEPTVLLVWGPLMIGGTFFVVTGFWSWEVALLSLVYALGPTSVLFGKHIDKLDADKAKGVHSLPVILGTSRARQWVSVMLILQYVAIVVLILLGLVSWAMLITLLNLPKLYRLHQAYQEDKPAERPDDFPREIWPLWYAAYAFDHTRWFSLLFLLGLLFEVVWLS